MATINEQIVTGRKFRKLADEINKLWLRISFWTKACDVEFDDGTTAEIKVGAINGVTDSLTSTASNIAASAAAVKALNDKITQIFSNLRDKVYYIKGYGMDDGVGEYTFTAPITGVLYIYGMGSTMGYYLKLNGTTVFSHSAGLNQSVYRMHAIEITQGDTITLYSQGNYICFLTSGIDVSTRTFATNIPN